MPKQDGNGPVGMGPGTGWGRGPCGAGQGCGRKFNQGFSFRRFWTKSEEKESLQEEKEMLEMHLVSSQQRLDVIEEKLLKFNK